MKHPYGVGAKEERVILSNMTAEQRHMTGQFSMSEVMRSLDQGKRGLRRRPVV